MLNEKGRLKSVTDSSGSETYSYDGLGRITQMQKVITGTTYTVGYGYNQAGELTSLTYPSGRVVTQSYDAAGRLSSIASGGTQYVNTFSYNAAAQVTGFKYGADAVTAAFGYSPQRLQLQTLAYTKPGQTLFSLSYGYAQGGGNNGQITSITDNVVSGRTATYTYDALHRLKTAVTVGGGGYNQWGLSWTYDRYGNRTAQSVTAGTGPSNSVTIGATTNRIIGAPYAYDANGNMTNDGLNALTYDAENRVVSAAGATYTYDGSGLRVKKVSSGNTTVYIFSGPQAIAEYLNGAAPSSPTREYVYSGAARIATHEAGSLKFQMSDHLSHRVTTDTSGNIVASSGHYPFGEQWYNTSGSKWLFTTYERDSESGNDYAIFRFHANRLGRFGAPDPLAGSIGDPQSLNRYVYVLNDAVNAIDPLGLQHRRIEPFMQPGTDQRTCVVDGLEQSCGGVSFGAVLRLGLIQVGSQLYQRVRVPVKRRSVDVSVEGAPGGGTDYYEWEVQLRLVKTNDWIDFAWWRAYTHDLVSWESFGRAQLDARDKGYYSCLGNEMFSSGKFVSPVAGKVVEEAAVRTVEHTRLAERLAGAYFHFTDGRFTAWGTSSRVLVPNAAANIRTVARGASVVGWAYFNYELAHAIGTCSATLK